MNTTTQLNDAVMTALEKRREFVSDLGGYWELTEFDQEMNDISREVIKVFYAQFPDAWVGVYNRHDYTKDLMKKYEGEKVYNFQWKFIVPEFNQQVLDLITEYNDLPYSECSSTLDEIFDLIYKLHGVDLNWV